MTAYVAVITGPAAVAHLGRQQQEEAQVRAMTKRERELLDEAVRTGAIAASARRDWEGRLRVDPLRGEGDLNGLIIRKQVPTLDRIAAAASGTVRASGAAVVTASGIDPQVVAGLPELVRPIVAAETNPARANELAQRYAGPDGDLQADLDALDSRSPIYEFVQDQRAVAAAEQQRAWRGGRYEFPGLGK